MIDIAGNAGRDDPDGVVRANEGAANTTVSF
ncbi:hypothetical protein ACVI1T_004857 [Rhizobium redzepovicii]